MEELGNFKGKRKRSSSKTVDYAVKPKGEDVAMIQSIVTTSEKEEAKEYTDEEIKNAMVFSNGYTSIDFLLPEEEQRILRENVNVYENIEDIQKVLSVAKRNKKISEDIKSLELISKSGALANNLFDVLNSETNIEMLNKYLQRKFEEGDLAKGYKEVATAAKIMLDAREEMTKRLSSQKSGKNARIALKFTNDNGDDFELGVDI